MSKKLISIIILVISSLIFTSCTSEVSASVVRLSETKGTVELYDENYELITQTQDMKIFDGYSLSTGDESYAFVDLDETKLVKFEEESLCAFNESGKNISLELKEGSMFFNVSKPLEDDETFDITTSTTVTSIRGTSGYIYAENDNISSISLFTGKVDITLNSDLEDDTVSITAGQKLSFNKENGTVDISDIDLKDYGDFVLNSIAEDEDLLNEVESQTGIDNLSDEIEKILNDDETDIDDDDNDDNDNIDGEIEDDKDEDETSEIDDSDEDKLDNFNENEASSNQNYETSEPDDFDETEDADDSNSQSSNSSTAQITSKDNDDDDDTDDDDNDEQASDDSDIDDD